jgi:hypothetical protein
MATGVRSKVRLVTKWTHGRTQHLSLVRQWREAMLQSYMMVLEGGGQGRSQDLDIGGRIIECPETIYGITVKS